MIVVFQSQWINWWVHSQRLTNCYSIARTCGPRTLFCFLFRRVHAIAAISRKIFFDLIEIFFVGIINVVLLRFAFLLVKIGWRWGFHVVMGIQFASLITQTISFFFFIFKFIQIVRSSTKSLFNRFFCGVFLFFIFVWGFSLDRHARGIKASDFIPFGLRLFLPGCSCSSVPTHVVFQQLN